MALFRRKPGRHAAGAARGVAVAGALKPWAATPAAVAAPPEPWLAASTPFAATLPPEPVPHDGTLLGEIGALLATGEAWADPARPQAVPVAVPPVADVAVAPVVPAPVVDAPCSPGQLVAPVAPSVEVAPACASPPAAPQDSVVATVAPVLPLPKPSAPSVAAPLPARPTTAVPVVVQPVMTRPLVPTSSLAAPQPARSLLEQMLQGHAASPPAASVELAQVAPTPVTTVGPSPVQEPQLTPRPSPTAEAASSLVVPPTSRRTPPRAPVPARELHDSLEDHLLLAELTWARVADQPTPVSVDLLPGALASAPDPGPVHVPAQASGSVEPPVSRVQLGFRDGTSAALAPDSEQAAALQVLAQLLNLRD